MARPDLIRRFDWQFLVPGPLPVRRLLLLGASPELVRQASALGIANHVELDSDEMADIVVRLATSPVSVKEASRLVTPNGTLCVEVDRFARLRLAHSAGSIHRQIRGAGLAVAATYWVTPRHERPTRFIRIDHRHAFRWYLRTIQAPAGPMRAVVRWAADVFLTRTPSLLGAVARRHTTIATRPGVSGVAAVLREVAPLIADSRVTMPVVITGGQGEWSRVTGILFPPAGKEPVAVLKFPRLATFNAQTEHEQRALASIAEHGGPAVRASVPRPIATPRWRNLSVAVQSYAHGRSMFAVIHRWPRSYRRSRVALGLATDWLVQFHTDGAARHGAVRSEQLAAMLEADTARFVDAFGPSLPAVRLEAASAATVTPGSDDFVPLVLRHKDFGPWSVFLEGQAVRILDWEVADVGLAVTDLIYFALHWTFATFDDRTTFQRARRVRTLFNEPASHRAHRAVHAELVRYMEALSVPTKLLRPLVVATLVEQALDRNDRLAAHGTADDDPLSQNPYVAYLNALV